VLVVVVVVIMVVMVDSVGDDKRPLSVHRQ
jgi:hypothetical protein